MNSQPDSKWGSLSRTHDPYILANFVPRQTDILITTAPKAGTTWMQQILHQLRTGGDESFNSVDDVVPWLEYPRESKTREEILNWYEAIKEPRVFKTHCTYEQTPGGVSTARIILSSRDPRDCCVSFYHHITGFTETARNEFRITNPETFDEHVDNWLEYAAWYRNIKSWWPYHDHPNVLWLRYQDMKTDLNSCINKILSFLNWNISDDQRKIVIEYSSMSWMKSHEKKFAMMSDKKEIFTPGSFIRKGQVGDYQSLMTKEHEERILNKAKELLEPEALNFLEIDI